MPRKSTIVATIASVPLSAPAWAQDYLLLEPPCNECTSAECDRGFLAYVYLSPLMDFFAKQADQVKFEDSSGTDRELVATGVRDIPDPRHYFQNQIFYLTEPADCDNPVVRPNTDSLYVVGQFDLTKGPVSISIPEMKYGSGSLDGSHALFSVQFVDPWTNSFFHLGPWGDGTTGSVSPVPVDISSGDFSARTRHLYWTGWDNADEFVASGKVDPAELIPCDDRWVWMLGRVAIPFGELDPTLEICDAFESTSWTWAPRQGFEMIDLRTATWDCNPLAEGCDGRLADYGTECTDVTAPGFDPIEYLDLAAKTLEIASIPDDLLNNWYRDLLRDIGVDPEIGGPSNAGLDAFQLEEIRAGFRRAVSLDLLCGGDSSACELGRTSLGYAGDEDDVEWDVPPAAVGDFGDQMLLRAYVAQIGLGADSQTYEYYPNATRDASGEGLVSVEKDGSTNSYILIMDDSIDDYCSSWSLTMYVTDAEASTARILCEDYNQSCEIPDGDCITAIGTLKRNWQGGQGMLSSGEGGCYRILVSPDPPDASETDIDWLPSPDAAGQIAGESEARFQVTLRVFNAAFDEQGTIFGWTLPCITPLEPDADLPDCASCLGETARDCLADLTGDGIVGSNDLAALLATWGDCPVECPADLDGDDIVGAADLARILGHWGACPAP